MDVADKVAVVTGGGQGLGRGIALALAGNGADVIVADIDLEAARRVADEVSGMGRSSTATLADVTNQASVERMVQDTVDRFGRIDILVNNAGIMAAPGWEERDHTNEDDWDMIYEVNVKGIVRVTEAAAPHMKERRYGKIINISSGGGRQGSAKLPAYGVSKAGVINLTQAFALNLAPYNINVNAICPGFVWTPMNERLMTHRGSIFSGDNPEGLSPREVYEHHVEEITPLKRGQTPEDISNLAAFLASDYSRNITGQSINVNGGTRMD